MKYILKRLLHLFYIRHVCCFYKYDRQTKAASECPDVLVYQKWSGIPLAFRNVICPNRFISGLYYRLRFGTITLLCYSRDGEHLDGYGFMLPARQYRCRFGLLVETDGVMLAHFWTAPALRKQGIYVRILRHALTLYADNRSAFIYTTVSNIASQKGIERAGFARNGRWESCLLLSCIRILRPVKIEEC
jgi:GNAT superfamily N-acetyltransferase